MHRPWFLFHGIAQNFIYKIFTVGNIVDTIRTAIERNRGRCYTTFFIIFGIVWSRIRLHGITQKLIQEILI